MNDAQFETQLSQAFHAPIDRPDDAVAERALARLARFERRRRLVLAAAALTGFSLTGAGIAGGQALARGAALSAAAQFEPLLQEAAAVGPWALAVVGLAVSLMVGARYALQEG